MNRDEIQGEISRLLTGSPWIEPTLGQIFLAGTILDFLDSIGYEAGTERNEIDKAIGQAINQHVSAYHSSET